MRKLLLAVAVLSISLFACKKDTAPTNPNPPAASGEKFPVSFSVTDFLQKLEELPAPTGRKTGSANTLRDSVLAGKVSHLYYLIYNDQGQHFKSVHQVAADSTSDFGNYVDTLPAGRYSIALIASTGPVQLVDSVYYYNMSIRLPDAPGPIQTVADPDIFFANQGFNVTGYGPTQSIALYPSRLLGKLEVNILDAPDAGWPGDTSILVYASPTFRSYHVAFSNTGEQIGDPGMVLHRNDRTNFSALLMTAYTDVTVTIVYPDKITGERKTRELRYVPFARGYRTVMTGSIYNSSNAGGTAFSISLDTAWYNYAEVPF